MIRTKPAKHYPMVPHVASTFNIVLMTLLERGVRLDIPETMFLLEGIEARKDDFDLHIFYI